MIGVSVVMLAGASWAAANVAVVVFFAFVARCDRKAITITARHARRRRSSIARPLCLRQPQIRVGHRVCRVARCARSTR